ncbi:hypothetical protein ABR737_05110 [Streptomyces sp. Edi2]|uniref:hypothetical protein n=1 Tax=Streptomyces sp. Edi2 TaxID=3162528 RepID=UPI003305E99C
MQEKSAIARTSETAAGVHAPGHLGELTQIVDFALVDAVLDPHHGNRPCTPLPPLNATALEYY